MTARVMPTSEPQSTGHDTSRDLPAMGASRLSWTNRDNTTHDNDDLEWFYRNLRWRERDEELDDESSCSQSRIFIAIVLFLTVISITFSTYVGYVVTTEGIHCDCLSTSQYAEVVTPAIVIDYDMVKKNLELQIERLREKITEENKTDSPFGKTCAKKSPKECEAQMIDNLTKQIDMVKTKFERLLSEKTNEIYEDLDEARTGIEEMINTTQTIQTRQSPQCVFKMKNATGSESRLRVTVPQQSKSLVTVSATCSTTAQNISVVKVVDVNTKIPQFSCHCHNNNQEVNHIDCTAYYWQCNIQLQ